MGAIVVICICIVDGDGAVAIGDGATAVDTAYNAAGELLAVSHHDGAGHVQVVDICILRMAERCAVILVGAAEVDGQRAAVAVEVALEPIVLIVRRACHQDNRLIAIVKVVGQFDVIGHIILSFVQRGGKHLPLAGIADNVGITLRARARQLLIHHETG